MNNIVKVIDITIANNLPFVLVAGPCQIETLNHALLMAEGIRKIADKLKIPFIYKSSFDKANRTSASAQRGTGIDEGLEILAKVKSQIGCPILTDVHNEGQCNPAAEVVDVLQIPAFLCRQTDLLKAAADTGKTVKVKKGQFLAPWDMKNVYNKLVSFNANGIILTDRGTCFGYNTLVSDMRGLEIMAGDVVSFSDTDSISFEKFQVAKAKEIDLLQKQNGINLTEENIAELGIDNSVLKKLINDSMIDYLVKYYEFDISDEKVIAYVKKTPFFKNSNGDFDLSIFKAAFNNSPAKEEEYLASVKRHLITSTILGIFMDSFNPPNMMIENIVNYMSETRRVDVLSIDLGFKSNAYKSNNVSTEHLTQFYHENKELFMIPELRSFEYVKADREFLEKKLNVNEKEIKNYFEEYKDEFESKKFSEVKNQVREALITEKIAELSNELAKDFEEDVSSGLTITEISNKYGLQIKSISDIKFSDMSESQEADYIELADSVFEMAEGEVSYPIEVQDNSEVLLVSLKSITPGREQEFQEVETNIKDIIEKRDLAIYNMKVLREAMNSFDSNKIDRNILSAQGISISTNSSFTRADLPMENKMPVELLKEIFNIELNNTTNIIKDDNKAYFAYLKTINSNKATADKIRKNASEHFSSVIKEGVFQELISYLTRKNNMKLKTNSPGK